MNEDRLRVYLDRMSVAASRVLTYVSAMEQSTFEAYQRTQDAVVANVAAIGECVGKVHGRISRLRHRASGD